jgi:hypothetical protein
MPEISPLGAIFGQFLLVLPFPPRPGQWASRRDAWQNINEAFVVLVE